MLKFLIIMVLVIYLTYKVGQFLFKILFLGAGGYAQQQRTRQHHHQSQPKNANVSIDYVPEDDKGNSSKGYGGGEYVDYEEVK